ncbi:hypothetical protein Cgig2_008709 [Carnegiea gigantea]|uniref:Uncharacterized protein n=1 Tax=Carnegiea gigantea TaxID=171969 RepID=A0A9Q1JND5_9CARY|nr:hypothetical protein Cgig2_008709 [Carnegiea gigantea]
MGRAPCCDKNGLKKGPWTPEEDQKLIDYIQKHGYGNWRTLPKNAGLQRCGKSCRLRWTNYLRPDIKRGRFSFEEEETIIQLHSILGNKWSAIAARLPGRTDNEIKNYWNTHIRKRLLRMGIDPVTHSPRLDLLDLSSILGNSSLYNTTASSQMNMPSLLGLQPMVNPDFLKLATSLLSSTQNPNPSSSLIQDLNLSAQIQSGLSPLVQTSQIQAPIQTPVPSCTTMTTTATATTTDTSRVSPSVPFFNEAQLMDQPTSFGQYPSNNDMTDFGDQTFDQWQSQEFLSSSEGLVGSNPILGYCGGSHHTFMDPSISDNSNFGSNTTSTGGGQQSYVNFAPSVMSTPSSSPTVDERESYCSENMMMINKFEIPDFLDVNQFMLAQTNC